MRNATTIAPSMPRARHGISPLSSISSAADNHRLRENGTCHTMILGSSPSGADSPPRGLAWQLPLHSLCMYALRTSPKQSAQITHFDSHLQDWCHTTLSSPQPLLCFDVSLCTLTVRSPRAPRCYFTAHNVFMMQSRRPMIR
jgi:hypothetical protein